MPISVRRSVVFTATTLCLAGSASAALAAQASAAVIAANRACYVNTNPGVGAPMTITGSGFTPGGQVGVYGGTSGADATAGPTGAFAVTTNAPILPTIYAATEKTTLTATDYTTNATAALTVFSANLAVSVNPTSVRHVARTKVTYKFSGFTPGKRVYGFWRRKKVVARMKFGKASGPCGTLRQKALMYPGGHPRNDTYTVTFEQSKKFSKKVHPQVNDKLTILRF